MHWPDIAVNWFVSSTLDRWLSLTKEENFGKETNTFPLWPKSAWQPNNMPAIMSADLSLKYPFTA